MKQVIRRRGTRGQALLEMAVILPVCILFLAAITPLIIEGTIGHRIDERLLLRLLYRDDQTIHSTLRRSHAHEQLPPYFRNSGLRETSSVISGWASRPHPGCIFPGRMVTKTTEASSTMDGWWNRILPERDSIKERHQTRRLTMLEAVALNERSAKEKIKRLSATGLAQGIDGVLEKIGIQVFHLNYDALPEGDRGTEK